jgi:hypothetical protein
MASLLCPAGSCRCSASFRLSSPAQSSLASRRHHGCASSSPVASPAVSPSPPRTLAAAAYGGNLLRPVDTQTIIIAAAVVSAISLSLILGLKVADATCFFFPNGMLDVSKKNGMLDCYRLCMKSFRSLVQGDPEPCDRCAGNGILQRPLRYILPSLTV